MWLNLYGFEAVRHKLKNSQKNTKNAFLACFRAYVGQPHGHIYWATSMPFASINSNDPGTNLWNFHEIFLSIGNFENLRFFKSAILIFFFNFFFFFFCFIPMKISPNLNGRMDVSKFWCFLLCVILRYTVYIFHFEYVNEGWTSGVLGVLNDIYGKMELDTQRSPAWITNSTHSRFSSKNSNNCCIRHMYSIIFTDVLSFSLTKSCFRTLISI